MLLFNCIWKAKQLISFDGLNYGGASLSDIDFCLEYHDSIWVLGEVKGRDVILPKSQRTLMSRFVNMARYSGKRAIAIVVEHNVPDCREMIQLSNCMVREYYTSESGRWAYPRRPYYVDEMISQYINIVTGGFNGNGQITNYLQKTG